MFTVAVSFFADIRQMYLQIPVYLLVSYTAGRTNFLVSVKTEKESTHYNEGIPS